MKHFKALGMEVHYKAPVKEYNYFKTEVDKTINSIITTPADDADIR
jgi:type III restriction enzyme